MSKADKDKEKEKEKENEKDNEKEKAEVKEKIKEKEFLQELMKIDFTPYKEENEEEHVKLTCELFEKLNQILKEQTECAKTSV